MRVFNRDCNHVGIFQFPRMLFSPNIIVWFLHVFLYITKSFLLFYLPVYIPRIHIFFISFICLISPHSVALRITGILTELVECYMSPRPK
jgi:hypothetical protein